MPILPPITVADHLIGYWLEIGRSMSSEMGGSPFTWQEIGAWSAHSGIDLAPWEGRILRRLSEEYLAESAQAKAPDRPPPYTEASPVIDRELIGRKVGNAFKAMARRK